MRGKELGGCRIPRGPIGVRRREADAPVGDGGPTREGNEDAVENREEPEPDSILPESTRS